MPKMNITGFVKLCSTKKNNRLDDSRQENVTHISIEHPKKELPTITVIYHVDFVARKLVKKEVIDNKIDCNPKK